MKRAGGPPTGLGDDGRVRAGAPKGADVSNGAVTPNSAGVPNRGVASSRVRVPNRAVASNRGVASRVLSRAGVVVDGEVPGAGRMAGLWAAVRAEVTKVWTLRSWRVTALLTVVGSLALGFLVARGQVEATAQGEDAWAGLLGVGGQVAFLAQIGPIVLGALAGGSEYQAGQLRLSLSAVPGRGVFVMAKAAATVLAGLVVGGGVAGVALLGAWAGWGAASGGVGSDGPAGGGGGLAVGGGPGAVGSGAIGGETVGGGIVGGGGAVGDRVHGMAGGAGPVVGAGPWAEASWTDTTSWVAGVALYAAGIGLCALGLALAVRSVLVPVGVLLALAFGISRALALLPGTAGSWSRFLPDRAGSSLYAAAPTPDLLGALAGGVVFGAWALVAIGAGWWAVRRRDVG